MVVDTTATPPAEALNRVLGHLGLETQPLPALTTGTPVVEYVGIYVPSGPSSERDRVEISLKQSSLFATLYWPEGCTLLLEEDDLFRLQATNRMVRFRRDDLGRVSGFDFEMSWKGIESYVRWQS